MTFYLKWEEASHDWSGGGVVQAEGSSSAKVIKPVWAWVLYGWMGQENQGPRGMERRTKGREGLVFRVLQARVRSLIL